MKVYELISALSSCSAGAEVEFHTAMTLDELAKCEVADSVNGRDVYAIPGKIQEVFSDSVNLVILYR